MTAPFPGRRWTPDDIAEGLKRAEFLGYEVYRMGAIIWAESAGYELAWGWELSPLVDGKPQYRTPSSGLGGVSHYWLPQIASRTLLAPFLDLGPGHVPMAKLLADGDTNLRACREIFEIASYQRGYANAYTAWSGWNTPNYNAALPAAKEAAKKVGAIP